MSEVLSFRLSVDKTGLSLDVCKNILQKWLAKYCASWIIVEEEEPDNLHWQGWVTVPNKLKRVDLVSNPLGYAFKDAKVSGNALKSVVRLKKTFDDIQRYTMKGRSEGKPVHIVSVQYLPYNDDYVKKWHVEENWYKKQKNAEQKAKDASEHITVRCITYFKERPWDPYTDHSFKERDIAKWLMAEWKESGKVWPGDYIFCNYITTVLARIDVESEGHIIERCLHRLNK